MRLQDLKLTDKESEYIRNRFFSIKSYERIAENFPEFDKGLKALPYVYDFRANDILNDMFFDAVCEARGVSHGAISPYDC